MRARFHKHPQVALCIGLSLVLGRTGKSLDASAHRTNVNGIRIGVDQAAPYQSWREGYGPVGFSVDVLTEAAHKRGVRLDWIDCPEGPSKAILSHKVDMWPLVSAESGYRLGLYVSEPWVHNEYAVVWKHDRTLPKRVEPDWRQRTLSILDSPRSRTRAAIRFSQSKFDLTQNRTIAMQHMCSGLSTGAFMEVRLLEPMLLDRPPGCEGISLGVQVSPALSDALSLVARPEFRAEADALRAEIGLMLIDGRFERLVDKWFVFSNVEAHSMIKVARERERNTYILVLLGMMSLFVCGLLIAIRSARRAKSAAESASRAKSTFLSNVSHEVRTPMNGILGTCDVLLSTPLTAQQKEYAEMISESARLQLRLLNELLDSAKIEAGKLTLEAIPFRPADLIKEIERSFRADASKKGLAFHVESVNLPPAVMGDPFRVRQIVSNLVGNALKFTTSGEIRLKMEALSGRLLITVSDTGIGMSSKAQADLFQKFVQADESTTRRFGGTGLGLSICRDLAELMGGSIAVESAEGVGTSFRVSLPLPAVEANLDRNRSVRQEGAVYSERPLLIVEDNLVNQKVAAAMLRSFGLEFRIANNGKEAIAMCAVEDFAAILMDCQMPEMDGLEATRRLRASGSLVPILALTASASDGERRLAFEAGMNDFLPKPVSRTELLSMLQRWLQETNGSQTNDAVTVDWQHSVVPHV